MMRTILIVDDIKSNREILKNILGDEYSILGAADGREALAVMNRDAGRISAVLLDLGMPVMDGFEVLSCMRGNEALSQLPVIVTTGQTDSDSEERALRLGAKDYISKPYKSAIIKQRIWNTIDLRETAATVNALRRDRLTGLYGREAFFEKAAQMASAREPGYYVLSCFDIDNFKVVNDQYGTAAGDEVLRYVARCTERYLAGIGGICGRIMADNFAMLYPRSYMDSAEIARNHEEAAAPPCISQPIRIRIGRYIVTDPSMPPSAMYDRASLAEESIKGRYDCYVAVYDESMREFLLGEQRIVTEMDGALQNRQFEVWFQPQYNHTTGALIGAEALVRWRHPERGLIPPSAFVPIFEKNGFIYRLDKFVWEETCRHLRKWRGEGRNPLPVSVNISRYDIFRPDLIEVLSGLTERYGIPADLLRLEITESAFVESDQQIVRIVRELIGRGFTVEIDDFGSGYSSLNTLKSVPAQVVKLDMRFLEDDDGSGRGGNILESIVRMAKWLGMSVIAEGVEDLCQADYLKSIGCSYVQGYLYARPMPAPDYENHCAGASKEERLLTLETVENLDNNAFWDPRSMDTLIFNSYVGAACIYEYSAGRVELLRATDKFARMLGGPAMTVDQVLKLELSRHLDAAALSAIDAAVRSGEETWGEFLFTGLPGCPQEVWLRSTMRVIAAAGSRCLLYCTNENITAQRVAEQSERRVIRQMQAVMESVSCGITAVTLRGEEEADYLLANDRYYQLLDYTREQYQAEVGSRPFKTIHPEDLRRVRAALERVQRTGKPAALEFRALRRDGAVIWLRTSISVTEFEGVDAPVQLCVYTDVTAERQAAQELLDNLPGGAALYEYHAGTLSAVHLNKRYWELVDRAPADQGNLRVMESIHPDDRKIVLDEMSSAIRQERDAVCELRILHGRDGYRPFRIVGRIVPRGEGKYAVYASYTPITAAAMSVQEMLPIALTALMAAQTDYAFIKDRSLRYLCCSQAFARMAGLEDARDAVGKSDQELFEPDFAQSYAADDRLLLESGQSVVDKVERIASGDGGSRYVSTSKFPLYDSEGNAVGIFGVSRDITEDRSIKSRLELLTNSIPGGIAVYEGSPDALDRIRLTYFSDGFCRLFGYTREEYVALAAENALGLVFSEDLGGMMEQVAALARQGTPLDCVYRARTKGGGFKWINIKAVPGEPNGENHTVNAVLFDVTERQEALERLRVSEEENRLAVQHSGSAVCRYDIVRGTISIPEHARLKYNLPETVEDVPEGPIRRGNISPETADAYRALFEGIARGGKNGSAIYQRRAASGWRWLEAHASTIFSGDGAPVTAVLSLTDITERLEKDIAYRKWQQSLANKDAGSYSLFRCSLTQKTTTATAEGSLLRVQFPSGPFRFDQRTAEYAARFVDPEDRARFVSFLSADALLAGFYQGTRTTALEYREALEGDRVRWLRLTVDLVESLHSADVEAYLLFEDIDEAKRAELATRRQAETDPLTGVLNRAAFAGRVNQLLGTAKPGAHHTLMMLDIDGFKLVNDLFGHAAGDQTLMELADSLRTALRRDDLVGRLGGDEFVLFLTDLPDDGVAAGKARQICALTRRAFSAEVEISGSLGIAVAPRDGGDFETLYQKADCALYHVKGSGKDNYAFYHEGMTGERPEAEAESAAAALPGQTKKRRMLIVDDSQIDHAVLANLFSGEFLVEKALDGVSALVRLRHYGTAISVVLLDLMMPGMDGFAVLEKMRKSAEMRSIPVVVVSGDESREAGLRAIRAGASDFVTKPVDPDLLRIRVLSAISKAENERLRAKNSLLEFQNSEVERWRTVLARSGITVVEHDWVRGGFTYDPSIAEHLLGTYDARKLWHILLSDLVADTETVKRMQELVHTIAVDREKAEGSLTVRLKTPEGSFGRFRMSVYKVTDRFGLTDKLYLTFQKLGADRREEKDGGTDD